MNLFGLKLNVLIIAFFVFFLAIFSIRFVLNYYLIDRPLTSMLEQIEFLEYEIDKEKLTIFWEGQNPEKLIELLEHKSIKKRFTEVCLTLQVKTENEIDLWQEEALIIREGIENSQYYTAFERLKKLDPQVKMIVFESYLYVNLLGKGQLYELNGASIRLISKVVALDE